MHNAHIAQQKCSASTNQDEGHRVIRRHIGGQHYAVAAAVVYDVLWRSRPICQQAHFWTKPEVALCLVLPCNQAEGPDFAYCLRP